MSNVRLGHSMYRKWLCGWDEKQAATGDLVKRPMAFDINSNACFPDSHADHDIQSFCGLATKASRDINFYGGDLGAKPDYAQSGPILSFTSRIDTPEKANNCVSTRLTESNGSQHALVVLHHWNATKRNDRLASFYAKRGLTVAEMALPYHFERSRLGALHADYMLSANLGRTLGAVRQAVLDVRDLVACLFDKGYTRFSIMGMSLGSWIAGLAAAHDPRIERASLFLCGDSLADMVWTGRATRLIRESLEGKLNLDQLRSAWLPADLSIHAPLFGRADFAMQVILAKHDTVVLPEISNRLIATMRDVGCSPEVVELNCGHYSLGLPQYGLMAGLASRRFFAP